MACRLGSCHRRARGQESILHFGRRQPSRSAPQEIDFKSDRYEGHRVPRICVDLCGARPIDLAIVDGIETCTGGEGLFRMPYKTHAQMPDDPMAADNPMLLAESAGLGSADLSCIEVADLSIKEALFRFENDLAARPPV